MVALPKHNLILPIIGNGSSAVYFREKHFGIERELCLAFHCKPSLSAGVSSGVIVNASKGTVRKPDPQVGIEQAFTDGLYEIQWVDFAHGRLLRTL